MSKKYVPSGYQIIDIILPSDFSSGDIITASTEDEKLLVSMLVESNNNPRVNNFKPILLKITTPQVTTAGFVSITEGVISLETKYYDNGDVELYAGIYIKYNTDDSFIVDLVY